MLHTRAPYQSHYLQMWILWKLSMSTKIFFRTPRTREWQFSIVMVNGIFMFFEKSEIFFFTAEIVASFPVQQKKEKTRFDFPVSLIFASASAWWTTNFDSGVYLFTYADINGAFRRCSTSYRSDHHLLEKPVRLHDFSVRNVSMPFLDSNIARCTHCRIVQCVRESCAYVCASVGNGFWAKCTHRNTSLFRQERLCLVGNVCPFFVVAVTAKASR